MCRVIGHYVERTSAQFSHAKFDDIKPAIGMRFLKFILIRLNDLTDETRQQTTKKKNVGCYIVSNTKLIRINADDKLNYSPLFFSWL